MYLTTSKLAVAALVNAAAVAMLAAARVAKAVFLGTLRTNEVERVSEVLRYTVPEVRASRPACPPVRLCRARRGLSACLPVRLCRAGGSGGG